MPCVRCWQLRSLGVLASMVSILIAVHCVAVSCVPFCGVLAPAQRPSTTQRFNFNNTKAITISSQHQRPSQMNTNYTIDLLHACNFILVVFIRWRRRRYRCQDRVRDCVAFSLDACDALPPLDKGAGWTPSFHSCSGDGACY